jgi:site-specific DNA recombinase
MASKDTAPKRAVIYVRISKDKAGAGVGVAEQEKQCREVADRLGLEVAAVYADNDITAFRKGRRAKRRPGYLGLLEDIRSHRADAVIAWHTDRLHRDLPELEEYIDACGEGRSGVPTYTVKGGDLDLSTSSGRMVARILGAVARQEVEHMIERQLSATKRLREAGAWKGGPRPFGYRRDGPPVGAGGEGRLAQVPEEAAAIRDGYRRVLAGESTYAVARSWNEAGLRTTSRKRNPWDQVHVRRVLLRAVNAGLVEANARDEHGLFPQAPEIVGPGRWDPVVDTDTWRAVRAILLNPDRRTTTGPKPSHLLTGVLICGKCGSRRFRTLRPNGPTRPVYVCREAGETPGAVPGKRCSLARDATLLDAYIESIIVERLSRPDVTAALSTRPDVDIPALDGRRTEINAQLEEWARTPGITPRQLQITNGPLLAELAEVERQISEGLRGDPLPEFAGQDPAKVWAALKEDGNIERMRAIAAMMLRVRLQPVRGRKRPPGWRAGMPHGLHYDAIEILPPDA